VAALLFVLIRAIPNISYPLGRDQATYCVIGQGLLHGQQLYRDLWDNKPPGVFPLYALLVKVFGHAMWAVGLVDILWLLVLSYCVFRFAERYLGTGAAVIAVGVNAAWHINLGYVGAGQPEGFLLLAVFGAFFLASARGRWPLARQFVAGLLVGAAFWLKYNALVFFPLAVLMPYVDWAGFDCRPRQVRFLVPWRALCLRAAAASAGFLSAVAIALTYFRLAGSWTAMKEVEFQVLPRYAAIAVERIPHYWAIPIATTLVRLGLGTVLAAIVAVLAAERRGLARFLPILAATAMGYAATASQLRFPPYAFDTSFPFFAMIWGYLGVEWYTGLGAAARNPSLQSRLSAWVAASALGAVLLWYPARSEAKIMAQRYRDLAAWAKSPEKFYAHYAGVQFAIEHFPGKFQVIEALRKSLQPGEEIFVWGTDPLIYYLTNRQPPDRFVSNLALISPWGPPAWRQELVRDLRKSPPTFIVVSQHDQVPEIAFTRLDSEQYLTVYTDLGRFISTSYHRVGEFPDFVLYRLNATPHVP
jgi:hypothetical protein